MLTPDKWIYRHDLRLPYTFVEMRLTGQFAAAAISAILLVATATFQILYMCRFEHSKYLVSRCRLFCAPPRFNEQKYFFCEIFSVLIFLSASFQCICYSFGCVPFSLLVFGLEMHFSCCPWIDDYYRREVMRHDYTAVEKYFSTQCGINGWALAGVSFCVWLATSCKINFLWFF